MFDSGGKTDASFEIFLQKEFIEQPCTDRSKRLQWHSHEALLNFHIKFDQETHFSFENFILYTLYTNSKLSSLESMYQLGFGTEKNVFLHLNC